MRDADREHIAASMGQHAQLHAVNQSERPTAESPEGTSGVASDEVDDYSYAVPWSSADPNSDFRIDYGLVDESVS